MKFQYFAHMGIYCYLPSFPGTCFFQSSFRHDGSASGCRVAASHNPGCVYSAFVAANIAVKSVIGLWGLKVLNNNKLTIKSAALTLSFALAGGVQAADMSDGPGSLKDAPAHAFSWTGFYIGANAGYGFSDDENYRLIVLDNNGVPYPTDPEKLTYSLGPEGVFGGLQAGYNAQSGQLVFGVEADIQASDINDTSKTAYLNDPILPPPGGFDSSFIYTATQDIEWFGTLRARLGFASDETLIYITGGLAFGEVSYKGQYLILTNNATSDLKSSETKTGYVIGGGLEQAIDRNWSLKFEYQYIDLGSDKVASDGFFIVPRRVTDESVKTGFDNDFHTIRIGINYRLHDDPAPFK